MPIYQSDTFNWSGFYAGIYGGGTNINGAVSYGGGLDLGVNSRMDFYLLGAEVALTGLTDGTHGQTYGQVLGRGGFLLTDNLLGYGALGYGLNLGGGNDQNLLVGGGLEYAVGNNVSLDAQYLYGAPLTTGSATRHSITFGAKYHF